MQGFVLGISAFYHDAAAALVRGGEIVAAAQEERFSRKKHDPRFPRNAINYCLSEAFIDPREIAAVAFYGNLPMTIERAVRNFVTVAPKGEDAFVGAMTSLLQHDIELRRQLNETLGVERPLLFLDHHLSHAASAFYPSPFEQAAILTVDGVGDLATVTIGRGQGQHIELLDELRYPHSLGLLYSAFTSYCGFAVNSGEYKLMGLAPYGRPRYVNVIEGCLIEVREDGSFALNMDYFDFQSSGSMTSQRFHDLFGGPPRKPEALLDTRHADIAASIQQVTETIMLRLAKHALKRSGERNLVLAGGVALNCVANGKIYRERLADGLWVQPAAGDAGGALGAALYASHVGLDVPRLVSQRDTQKGSYLGPRYSCEEIEAELLAVRAPYERISDPLLRARRIASVVAEGKVVALFNGRSEFGPRSLGARSLIADPRRPEMQSVLNLKVKHRESFRPFAPAVLHDRVADVFDFEHESPYMLIVAPIREECRLAYYGDELTDTGSANLIDTINRPRSVFPAVTHVDYSARLQTVHPDDNAEFHRIVMEFYQQTGCPLLVNTSFNVRDEPIVNSPADAYRCFMSTEIELLVMEEFFLWKSDQKWSENNDDWRKGLGVG